MELEYTYTKEPDGWLVGYLNKYPGRLTQGKDVAELEHMLTDIYAIIQDGTMLGELEWEPVGRQHTGVLRIGTKVLKRQKLPMFGVTLKRHGVGHDIYGIGKKLIAVPRHSEIDERTAKAIIKFFSD